MQIQKFTIKDKPIDVLDAHVWLSLLIILALASFLRIYQLGAESFWVDEFHSLRTVQELETKLPVRFLYFLLLRGWMAFGGSDAWLRGLSVLFGIGSVYLTYQIGYQLIGRTPGLIAAFAIAVSPVFIFHSQEVRMYMLSTFLTLSGTLSLICAFNRPAIKPFFIWLIARLLAIYTTPINIILLLPDLILIFFRFQRQRRVFVLAVSGICAVGILFLPFASRFFEASIGFFSKASSSVSVQEIFGQLPAATVYWPMRDMPSNLIWLYGIWGLILIFLLAFLFLTKRPSKSLYWLTAWAFLPSITLLATSFIAGDVWTPRYLLLSSPYFIILFAAGFAQVWKWNRIFAGGIAITYAAVLSLGLLHYYGQQNVTDWRGAVQTINTEEQNGDRILVSSDFIQNEVFDHYYLGSASVETVDSLRTAQTIDEDQLAQDLYNLSASSPRLWILYERADDLDGQQHRETLEAVIDDQFEVLYHAVFSGYVDTLDLFLLAPQAANGT